jgi:hypothetical protein
VSRAGIVEIRRVYQNPRSCRLVSGIVLAFVLKIIRKQDPGEHLKGAKSLKGVLLFQKDFA